MQKSSTTPDVPLHDEVLRFLSHATGHTCTANDTCTSLGIDSVIFLELVIFIEKRFGIPLPLELITSQPLTTIRSLLTTLEAIVLKTPSPESVEA